jgi:hypothetical protein
MTKDDVLRMAHTANFEGFGNGDWVCTTEEIERFAALVAVVEREACADICDQHATCEGVAQLCAEAIRSRT